MNPRITPLSGTVELAVVSPIIRIDWNPADDSGVVQWYPQDWVVNNGEHIAGATKHPQIRTDIGEFALQTFGDPADDPITDPVTGADLTNVSGAGIMLLFKKVFSDIWKSQENDPRNGA